jgi:hypothetical protein
VTCTDTHTDNTISGPINDGLVLERAQHALDDFKSRIQGVPYEDKGVFFSEMLFVLSAVGPGFDGLVLESGRARGQSTYVLGSIFPQSTIVSVEFDKDSPDVPIAEGRLQKFDHIELLYGDSRRLLFDHLQPGAAVVIDGPKGFRAIRLALQLLRTGKAKKVFIHDTYKGLATRCFLESHVPGTVFSDHDVFVQRFKHLDEPCWGGFDTGKSLEWRPASLESSQEPSYGPTFACLSHDPGVSYGLILCRLNLMNFFARAFKSVSKKVARGSTTRDGA